MENTYSRFFRIDPVALDSTKRTEKSIIHVWRRSLCFHYCVPFFSSLSSSIYVSIAEKLNDICTFESS